MDRVTDDTITMPMSAGARAICGVLAGMAIRLLLAVLLLAALGARLALDGGERQIARLAPTGLRARR